MKEKIGCPITLGEFEEIKREQHKKSIQICEYFLEECVFEFDDMGNIMEIVTPDQIIKFK